MSLIKRVGAGITALLLLTWGAAVIYTNTELRSYFFSEEEKYSGSQFVPMPLLKFDLTASSPISMYVIDTDADRSSPDLVNNLSIMLEWYRVPMKVESGYVWVDIEAAKDHDLMLTLYKKARMPVIIEQTKSNLQRFSSQAAGAE